MGVLKERPTGTDRESYAWCPQCDGFVIALGTHCVNDDSHIVSYLSPAERNEEELVYTFNSQNPEAKKEAEENKIKAQNNGEKVRQYRESQGISRPVFARTLGVSYNTLINWESGFSAPSQGRGNKGFASVYKKLLEIAEEQEDEPNPKHDWKKAWIEEPEQKIKRRVKVKTPKPQPQTIKPEIDPVPQKQGVKFDQNKPPVSLIPSNALIEESKILAYGAKKYDKHNWRKGMDWSRLIDATFRHLLAFSDGEDIDPESGLSHLAHARCSLGFLIEYQAKSLGTDDRWRSS